MKIAVTGKGGVGKTTISAVLARLYAEEGKKVFAVDVDPDANLGLTCVNGGDMDTGKSRRVLKKKRVPYRPDFFTDILEEVDFTEIRYQNAGG